MRATWDAALETPTLGGAITLRSEIEILSRILKFDSVELSVKPNFTGRQYLLEQVYLTSGLHFKLVAGGSSVGYPFDFWGETVTKSYISTLRIQELFAMYRLAPNLTWNKSIENARYSLADQLGEFIALHIRNDDFNATEWNLGSDFTSQIVNWLLDNTKYPVVIIGSDLVPEWISNHSRVHHLETLGVALSVQLAVIESAKVFIGSASGIACAAIFSKVPYIIFKDPAHHREEMISELGTVDFFNFSTSEQLLLRLPSNFQTWSSEVEFYLRKWNL